jgi:hypothetical protein
MPETTYGGCQCGRARYQVEGRLARAYACHCRDCQKQTSSAFSISVPVTRSRLRSSGPISSFEKRSDSGATTTGFFCGKCGTRLYHVSSRSQDIATLKVGTLDDASEVRPASHLWVSRKQPWVQLDPNVPCFAEQPPDLAAWRQTLFPPRRAEP